MPFLPPLPLSPPALPLPLIVCSTVHSDADSMLDLVAGHEAVDSGAVTVVRCVGAMAEMHEGFLLAAVVARAVADVVDDDGSGARVVVTGFLQRMRPAEDGEEAAPRRVPALSAFLLCPSMASPAVVLRPLHLPYAGAANALVAREGAAHLGDPAMDSRVLVLVGVATTGAIVEMLGFVK